MINLNLEGKRAIVTGGSRGLGYGFAQALHDAGAEVVITGVQDHIKDAAVRLGAEGAAIHYYQGDLTDTDKLPEMVETCKEMLGGRIDILVNCAGMQYRCPAADYPEDKWRRVLDVNLNAVFFLSQLVGRIMLEQGYGRIINIASMTSWCAATMIPAYASSKGAIMQLTKALSNEWCGKGVTVNAIAPGYIVTEMTADLKRLNPDHYADVTARIPMGRWGQIEDLHGIVVFLASDIASYISGAIIPVDGGFLGK